MRAAAAPRAGARATGADGGAAQDAPQGLRYVPWAIAACGLIAVTAYVAGGGSGATSNPAAGASGALPSAPFASGGSGSAPDISNLSPRERADRLYDRIMRYAEEGKVDSVRIFAPMAMASIEMLGPELDAHARYDLARVAIEAGEVAIAAAQADTILGRAKTHLLGISLRARIAASQQNGAAEKAAWAEFMSVRDAELAKNLPEYQAHAADIEAATRQARGGS